MSLLKPGVLCRNVEIAQPPLQWGALVHCAASSQGKTRISDANACRGSPYHGLGGLGQPGRALQRPRDRVVPVACALSPQESLRRPQIRIHAAKLELKRFGAAHRHWRLQLPPAACRKVDEITDHRFGHAESNRGMKKGEELRQGRIKRPRHEGHAAFEVSEIRRGDDFAFQYGMMAACPPQTCRMPGVLNFPVTRRNKGGSILGCRASLKSGLPLAVKTQHPAIQSAYWHPMT